MSACPSVRLSALFLVIVCVVVYWDTVATIVTAAGELELDSGTDCTRHTPPTRAPRLGRHTARAHRVAGELSGTGRARRAPGLTF